MCISAEMFETPWAQLTDAIASRVGKIFLLPCQSRSEPNRRIQYATPCRGTQTADVVGQLGLAMRKGTVLVHVQVPSALRTQVMLVPDNPSATLLLNVPVIVTLG